ncbi:MAG: hypothetical protein ACJATT_000904 [Myxococcota bacterium]|jgi:hypothetical protein
MRTGLWMGLLMLAGCGESGPEPDDCVDPLTDANRASFADANILTECYTVAVCENGDFDSSESMSEDYSSYQYDASGQVTFVTQSDDGDDGTPCSTRRSFGVARTACTDTRMSRGCVVPNAPAVPVDEPLDDLESVSQTLGEARLTGGCRAVGTCVDASGTALEVWSHALRIGQEFELSVAARSTLAVYEVGTGSVRTTAHLTGPSLFAGESDTGWLYWDGPEQTACLDADFSLSLACSATLGVPDAIEQARVGR